MATPTSLAAFAETLAPAPPPSTPGAPITPLATAIPITVDQPEASGSGHPSGPDPSGDEFPDDDVAWLNINELNEAETEELVKCVNTCVERWKAAGPEVRKKMFALFAVAGIFISVCRHGHVLVICDMIRSGELSASFPFPCTRQQY